MPLMIANNGGLASPNAERLSKALDPAFSPKPAPSLPRQGKNAGIPLGRLVQFINYPRYFQEVGRLWTTWTSDYDS